MRETFTITQYDIYVEELKFFKGDYVFAKWRSNENLYMKDAGISDEMFQLNDITIPRPISHSMNPSIMEFCRSLFQSLH